jgi:phosphoribosylformylglycinamidine (FGAM) synthase-like enzyme
LQTKLLACIHKGLVESAHDVAEGGLFVTLAESGFHRNLGFSVTCQDTSFRRDAYWFGEAQSRVVISIKKEKLAEFEMAMSGIPLEKLGVVTNSTIEVDSSPWGNIREWKHEYDTAIEKEMESIVEV